MMRNLLPGLLFLSVHCQFVRSFSPALANSYRLKNGNLPTIIPGTTTRKNNDSSMLNLPWSTTSTIARCNTRINAIPEGIMVGTSLLLRGGAAKSAIINLSREGYNVQVLAGYSTVTALIMNAALRLYSSTKFPKSNKMSTKFLNTLFIGVTALCVTSGAFTAVLFNILGIYTKSALGMMNDQGYLAFRAAIHPYTRWGFRTFLSTLASFIGSFLLSLYAKLLSAKEGDEDDFPAGKWIFLGTAALTLLGVFHIKKVLDLATMYIFVPEFMNGGV